MRTENNEVILNISQDDVTISLRFCKRAHAETYMWASKLVDEHRGIIKTYDISGGKNGQ